MFRVSMEINKSKSENFTLCHKSCHFRLKFCQNWIERFQNIIKHDQIGIKNSVIIIAGKHKESFPKNIKWQYEASNEFEFVAGSDNIKQNFRFQMILKIDYLQRYAVI